MSTTSVVIPSHDSERFLGEAIESALAQDRRQVEVVVVDDGSSDGSVEIARSFPDVEVLEIDPCTAGAARNAGVAASRGDLVAFLDSDDRFLPGSLDRRAEIVERSEGAAVVLGHMRLLREPGAPVLPTIPRAGGVPEGCVPTAAVLTREIALRFPFDEDLRLGEDLDWLIRLRDAGIAIEVLAEEVVEHRLHDRNLSLAGRAYAASLTRGLARHLRSARDER